MPDTIEINLKELYVLLKGADSEIVKRYDDLSLSDEDYFKFGIYSDIISNSLSVVINLLENNSKSIGIDNSCRAIMEAFAVLEMDQNKKIDLVQKKMYRLAYSSVEYKVFTSSLENMSDEIKEKDRGFKDLEELKKIACQYFECNEKELDHYHKLDDPLFYLTKKLKEKSKVLRILSKNNIDIDNQAYVYSFFSFFIHPRCEFEKEIEDETLSLRLKLIYLVLNRVLNFALKLDFINQESFINTISLKTVYSLYPDYKTYVEEFKTICNKTSEIVGDQLGYMVSFYFDKVESLYLDMLYCLFLGENEMVTSKFKSFVELHVTACYLALIVNDNERTYKTLGFVLSSRLQLFDIYNKIDKKKLPKELIEEFQDLYDSYYKEAYGLTSFDDFLKKLKAKNLYSIKNNPKIKYKEHVQEEFNGKIDQSDYEGIMTLYDICLKMDHASGYNFNQTAPLQEYIANDAMSCCTTFVQSMVEWILPLINECCPNNDYEQYMNFLDYMTLLFEMKKNQIVTGLNKKIKSDTEENNNK